MTTPARSGCSTFALDLHWVSRVPPGPDLAAHLGACAVCRGYLAHLDDVAVARPRPPVRRREPRMRSWRAGVAAAAGAVAIAAGALLVAGRARDAEVGGYVGLKGMPSVQLVVRRGEASTLWNGTGPVRAGDALALRVACEGLSHVAIAAEEGGGRWSKLKDADCPAGAKLLPFTLLVDDTPGTERFAVVLSRDVLEDAAIARAAADGSRTPQVWTVRFDLPKAPTEHR